LDRGCRIISDVNSNLTVRRVARNYRMQFPGARTPPLTIASLIFPIRPISLSVTHSFSTRWPARRFASVGQQSRHWCSGTSTARVREPHTNPPPFFGIGTARRGPAQSGTALLRFSDRLTAWVSTRIFLNFPGAAAATPRAGRTN
jgi:hypothetical protein